MSNSEDSPDEGHNAHKRGSVEIPRSLSDVQRIKIDKMMSNPDKQMSIPSARKERALPPPPEFNRHVMGSTAGAGSGDFHTYRHIRRRNQVREEISDRKSREEDAKEEFQKRLKQNYLETESKTAKNRTKRQKQKERKKKMKEKGPLHDTIESPEGICESTHTPGSPIQTECLLDDSTKVDLERENDG